MPFRKMLLNAITADILIVPKETFLFKNFIDSAKKLFLQRIKKKVKFKEVLAGLRQFFATENPLKMIKNIFNLFRLKSFFILKVFKFLS